MIIVLDVSGALEILFQRSRAGEFASAIDAADWVIAPDLFYPEIANALWKYYKADLLSHSECIRISEDGLMLVDDFIDSKDLWKESLSESMKQNHPVYDMLYMILARRNDGTIISNDKKIRTLCKNMGIECIE